VPTTKDKPEVVDGGAVLATQANVLAALRGADITLEVEDSEVAARAMMERILSATSAAEVLAKPETLSMEDVNGVPLTIHNVAWRQSSFSDSEGPKVYAVIHATRGDDGSEAVITAGGRMVMAALYKLHFELDAFPALKVKLVAQNPTAGGRIPFNVEPA